MSLIFSALLCPSCRAPVHISKLSLLYSLIWLHEGPQTGSSAAIPSSIATSYLTTRWSFVRPIWACHEDGGGEGSWFLKWVVCLGETAILGMEVVRPLPTLDVCSSCI